MENVFDEDDKFILAKTAYVTTGSIQRDCLKFLYPSKPYQAQPIFLGDSRGVLYASEYKKGELEILKKTQPFPRAISCVNIISSSDITKEKIYFSCGNSIYFTNRRCQTYSKIEFDYADDISMFKVADSNIWIVANNNISKYEYGESTFSRGSFDNESLITCMFLTETFGKTNIMCLIGSEDSKIKVIDENDLICSINVSSIPSYLEVWKKSNHDLSENYILFGTQSGSLGLIYLEKDKEKANKISLKLIWEINQNKNLGAIVGIKSFDIDLDGTNEIIVIRSNGDINIYSVGNSIMNVTLVSKFQTGEVLTGMDIGKFRSIEENDIMISSYSGLVFSVTPQLNYFSLKNNQLDRKSLSKNIKDLSVDIELAKNLVEKKRSELNKQQNLGTNPLAKNPFQVNYKLTLIPKDAVYLLKIESEYPIEMILMQSSGVCLDILETITNDVMLNIIKDTSKSGKEMNGTHITNNNQEPLQNETNRNSKFLCTFKFKQPLHQLEILIRTHEGIADIINCTIIPNNKIKTAIVLEIPIKALSLHKKIDDLSTITENNQPNEEFLFHDENLVNTLTIKGKFSASEMNQIFSMIIPDIPEKTAKENMKYFLKSTFLNTVLEIIIDKEICRIKSIYLSPIVIIKEHVTKQADFRRKDLEFNIQIKTLSIFKILEIIDPLIQENFNLETEYKLIQAFKELGIDNGSKFSGNKNSGITFDLPEEYAKILQRSEKVLKKYKQRKINLNYLKGLIQSQLKNISKVRSITNLNNKLDEIDSVLIDYNFDKLIDLFKELKNI
jgi:hypothetical protein